MKSKNMYSTCFLISTIVLSCIIAPLYGQWTKHYIDQDLAWAHGVYVADMDDDDTLDVVATQDSLQTTLFGMKHPTGPNISLIKIWLAPLVYMLLIWMMTMTLM